MRIIRTYTYTNTNTHLLAIMHGSYIATVPAYANTPIPSCTVNLFIVSGGGMRMDLQSDPL